MLEGGRRQQTGLSAVALAQAEARRSWRAAPGSPVVSPGQPERTQRVSQMEPQTRWHA
jgi:hypothetical protein